MALTLIRRASGPVSIVRAGGKHVDGGLDSLPSKLVRYAREAQTR